MTTRKSYGEYLRGLKTKLVERIKPQRGVSASPTAGAKAGGGAPSTAPHSEDQRARRPRRRYHLGLDWGTSTTKMVLRDYDSPSGELGIAYLLRPSVDGHYRYPSTIAFDDGRLFFGDMAEERRQSCSQWWVSLKAHFALGVASPELPASLTVTNLAVFSLAHAMRLGLLEATRMADAVDHDVRFSVTVGVPVVELEEPLARGEYLVAVRVAYALAVREELDVQGIGVDAAVDALRRARAAVALADERRPSTSEVTYNWLRPELAAGMYWSFRSPAIDRGLYAGVDIGAGTTNAVFFRINSRHEGEQLIDKGGLSFYAGACNPPGIDAVDAALAAKTDQSPAAIRGQEAKLLENQELRFAVEPQIDRFVGTYRQAFSEAYRKERRQGPWNKLNLILFGGGSKLAPVQLAFVQPPWANLELPRVVKTLGSPPDLCEIPERPQAQPVRCRGDATFLQVAYGLAVHYLDFPPYRLPSEVSDLNVMPARSFRSFDDLGYNK